MTKIFCAKNYVLLKPLGEQKTKSGLITPDAQDKKPEVGVIFKIGLGKQPFPVKMQPGDKVVFKKYMSNEIPLVDLGEIINPVSFEDLTILIKKK